MRSSDKALSPQDEYLQDLSRRSEIKLAITRPDSQELIPFPFNMKELRAWSDTHPLGVVKFNEVREFKSESMEDLLHVVDFTQAVETLSFLKVAPQPSTFSELRLHYINTKMRALNEHTGFTWATYETCNAAAELMAKNHRAETLEFLKHGGFSKKDFLKSDDPKFTLNITSDVQGVILVPKLTESSSHRTFNDELLSWAMFFVGNYGQDVYTHFYALSTEEFPCQLLNGTQGVFFETNNHKADRKLIQEISLSIFEELRLKHLPAGEARVNGPSRPGSFNVLYTQTLAAALKSMQALS